MEKHPVSSNLPPAKAVDKGAKREAPDNDDSRNVKPKPSPVNVKKEQMGTVEKKQPSLLAPSNSAAELSKDATKRSTPQASPAAAQSGSRIPKESGILASSFLDIQPSAEVGHDPRLYMQFLLRYDPKTTDLAIRMDKHVWFAHRLVVFANSPKWRAMTSPEPCYEGKFLLELPGIKEPKHMKSLLQMMYNGVVSMETLAGDFDMLQAKGTEKALCTKLVGLAPLYELARHYSAFYLMEVCIRKICHVLQRLDFDSRTAQNCLEYAVRLLWGLSYERHPAQDVCLEVLMIHKNALQAAGVLDIIKLKVPSLHQSLFDLMVESSENRAKYTCRDCTQTGDNSDTTARSKPKTKTFKANPRATKCTRCLITEGRCYWAKQLLTKQ